MSKVKKLGILSAFMFACLIFSLILSGTSYVFAEEINNENDVVSHFENVKKEFVITEGASVRVDTKENGHSGIRFQTKLPELLKAHCDSLIADGAVFGVVIIPSDMLGENALTLETADRMNVLTKTYVEADGNLNFRAVVSNIPAEAYERDLTARGYISYKEEVFYTNTTTRNISYVANKALSSGEFDTNKEIVNVLYDYTRKTCDGSLFQIANGSASTFEYKKASYNGNDNAYHYYNQQSAGTGSYSTRLSYNVKNSDLDKYLVIKMAIPTTATTNFLYKGEFYQEGIKSPFSLIYQNFDFYTPDKTIIDDWNDFYSLNGNWFYSTYYLDSTKIKTGEITLTFGSYITNINLYFDSVTFMSKKEFANNFEYMPIISDADVKSCSPSNLFKETMSPALEDIVWMGNVATFNIKKSTWADRQFKLDGNGSFSPESYIVLTLKFNTAEEIDIWEIEMVNGVANWEYFDFYDENLNPVSATDRKVGQWYFAVSQAKGNNINNSYALPTLKNGENMFVTAGYFYEISEVTRNKLFK